MAGKSSFATAALAAEKAADIVAGSLLEQLLSLQEQLNELDDMARNDPMTPEDYAILHRFRLKVKSLDYRRHSTVFGR